jgi:hypothetical protein
MSQRGKKFKKSITENKNNSVLETPMARAYI